MTFRAFARGSALLACLLVLLLGAIDARGASSQTPTKLRAPTALWNAYPVRPRRLAAERTALRLPLPQSAKSVGALTQPQSKSAFVLLLLSMMIMLSAAFVLKPGLFAVRVGSSERETRAPRRRTRSWVSGQNRRGAQLGRKPESPSTRRQRRRDRPARAEQPEEPRFIRRPVKTSPSTKACEIKLWSGVAKCQLVATVAESDEVIAISRTFGKCAEEAPTTEALFALTKLREFVERYGWTVAHGRHWYQ
jgi:hypothetical protein